MRTYVTISQHLPICRECDELCMTMFLTREEYEDWWARHEAMGHTIEHGPEIPPTRREHRDAGDRLE